MWYFILNNKLFYFNDICQTYLDLCNKNNQYYCCVKNNKLKYKIFGSLMYIDLKMMYCFYENELYSLIKLYNDKDNDNYDSIILDYNPSCSITKSVFPQQDYNCNFIIPNDCPHKYNCHNRFCNEHNKDLIGYNFPFVKYDSH
ncbi:hypothetical protein [Alphaentomopoxvirus acuprea]|uniref:Uncharacterized protein n=1 Tax=Alphaentomopoxvirus acuprea TaxID=62099 RepID=W6JLP2_9POXV|nr:hypothetical protein BA82_gp216 [Anomala cuprea entomopoxvirus]BAO49576.1 hypothetical protein [Anomala cuprea entomopoxvirus]